jgi:hypothetical protein
MMTIESYFSEYPEPYKSKAFSNRSRRDCRNGFTKYAHDHAQALLKAFKWSLSPEGSTFWSNFYECLKQGKIMLNLPSHKPFYDPEPVVIPVFHHESKRVMQLYNDLMQGKLVPARNPGETHMSLYVNMLRKKGIPVRDKRIRDIRDSTDRMHIKVFYLEPEYISEQSGLQQLSIFNPNPDPDGQESIEQ